MSYLFGLYLACSDFADSYFNTVRRFLFHFEFSSVIILGFPDIHVFPVLQYSQLFLIATIAYTLPLI